jgi:molybdate transport system substrate-binding protein
MRARIRNIVIAGAACLTAALSLAAAQSPVATTRTADDTASVFPPWQHGRNSDAIDRGLEFTVPQIDVLADFHGDPFSAELVLYVGGNYFFAMAPLVRAFEAHHPELRGRLYWETIPPGLLVDQIKAGGRITVGNMTWTAKPDAYFAGLMKVKGLIEEGLLTGQPVAYVTNDLAIMVPKNNPANVKSLRDLGRPEVRVAMPNPKFEGIARQIEAALVKAGGQSLADNVYDAKVKDGSTILTHIHHRQTPLFLMQGVADAGVTWVSEAIFQQQVGNPITSIPIPASENDTAVYAGAQVAEAAHPQAAKAWLEFIRSPEALGIFEGFGFKAYAEH